MLLWWADFLLQALKLSQERTQKWYAFSVASLASLALKKWVGRVMPHGVFQFSENPHLQSISVLTPYPFALA